MPGRDEVLALFPQAVARQGFWRTTQRGWLITVAGDPGCWRCFLRFEGLDVRGYGDETTLEAAYRAARADVWQQYQALQSAVETL